VEAAVVAEAAAVVVAVAVVVVDAVDEERSLGLFRFRV